MNEQSPANDLAKLRRVQKNKHLAWTRYAKHLENRINVDWDRKFRVRQLADRRSNR